MREWKLDCIGKGNAERIKCFSGYDWKLEIMVVAVIIISVSIQGGAPFKTWGDIRTWQHSRGR